MPLELLSPGELLARFIRGGFPSRIVVPREQFDKLLDEYPNNTPFLCPSIRQANIPSVVANAGQVRARGRFYLFGVLIDRKREEEACIPSK
jgi:hypothetical protein